jgi:hypothetical protein
MARKRKKLNQGQQDRNAMILRFACDMNLHSIPAYQDWCLLHGFGTRLNKAPAQLEREYQHYKQLVSKERLKQNNREGNLRYVIEKMYRQEIGYHDLNNQILLIIHNGFRQAQNKKLLRNVLLQLDESTKLLNYVDYTKGIVSFVAHYALWLRPIAEWQPKTHNVNRQFSSLARHLFAYYDVPAFMNGVWHNGNEIAKGWFIHIGMGKNIRTAKSLPIKMTKKMAHCFLQAPADYDVKAAFRWAQIHALGGNKRIADAVAETRMARVFKNKDDEFWLSVLRFFITNPMLDTAQFNPIVDYIWHQKYENRLVFVDRGVARNDGPEQPNFSMNGRTPDTLLRQVDNWYRCLGKESRGENLKWVKSKYSDYRHIEGRAASRNMKVWTIRELLSSKELIAEGREQCHCVATYARSCVSRQTSIWTMDVQATQARQKLLTIELHHPTKTIRQVRGLRNRMATNGEMDVVRRWVHKEGLSIASYV